MRLDLDLFPSNGVTPCSSDDDAVDVVVDVRYDQRIAVDVKTSFFGVISFSLLTLSSLSSSSSGIESIRGIKSEFDVDIAPVLLRI